MKLSIITINYNNAEGLRKTMESVLSQTYKDFEYVVVDGASTDGSVEIVRQYADSLAIKQRGDEAKRQVIWISEPDTGIYNAMNKGIRMAHGEYLLFLNSGDFLIGEEVIEKVFENECTADILCARCNVSDNGKVVWTSNPPEEVTFGTLYLVGLAHQSTFIRKSLFEQYGYYDESFRYNADIEFWYRAIVDNGASTQKIDVITTDYNLDGVSEKKKNDPVFIGEHKRILAKPIYQKILSDYKHYKSIIPIAQEYQWINKYTFLRRILRYIHKVVK